MINLNINSTIVYSLIATIGYWAAWNFETWPMSTRILIILIASVFGFAAIITAANWIAHNAASRWAQFNAGQARIILLRTIQQMSPGAQYEIGMRLGFLGANWQGLAGNVTPAYTVTHGVTPVPMWFIQEFLDHSDRLRVQPIRNYPDGLKRDYARAVTQFLVEYGYAEPAAGNEPARWIGGGFERAHRFYFGGGEQ